MNQISSTEELLTAIASLEAENVLRVSQLREEFGLTVDKFSPALAVTKTICDVASSSHLTGEFLGTAFGIVSGWLSRKLYVRGSSSIFKKVIGIAIQLVMTNLAANNFDIIKSLSRNLFHASQEDKEDTPG